MGRIGMNLSGIERSLLNRLAEANATITLSAMRMATGHKINFPSDDPSGFVYLAGLQSQLGKSQAASRNVTAAADLLRQTQSALDQMDVQVGIIRAELLKDADGGLTPDERVAAQAKIDAALDRIDALANTDVGGRRTLDGSADFTVSGRLPSQVANLAVYSTGGITRTIQGRVTANATRAQLSHEGAVATDISLQITGNRGVASISASSGELLSSVAAKINRKSYLTGVTATADDDLETLTFTTIDYGSEAAVAVEVTEGVFALSASSARGTNAAAVINGQTIAATDQRARGNRFSVSEDSFRFDIEFAPAQSGDFQPITVGGDALTFALGTNLGRRSTLALPGMQTARLGGLSGMLDQLRSGGSLSGLGDNTAQAILVADEARGNLTRVQGRAAGFRDSAITSASHLLAALQSDLHDAIDAVDKTDDAEELALQSRAELLANNSLAGLSILQQQRQSIAALIKQIAGLS